VSGMDPLKMARPEGLEPPTCGFEGRRSIQMSYGRVLAMTDRVIVARGSEPEGVQPRVPPQPGARLAVPRADAF
jgi:hypothetical protein